MFHLSRKFLSICKRLMFKCFIVSKLGIKYLHLAMSSVTLWNLFVINYLLLSLSAIQSIHIKFLLVIHVGFEEKQIFFLFSFCNSVGTYLYVSFSETPSFLCIPNCLSSSFKCIIFTHLYCIFLVSQNFTLNVCLCVSLFITPLMCLCVFLSVVSLTCTNVCFSFYYTSKV